MVLGTWGCLARVGNLSTSRTEEKEEEAGAFCPSLSPPSKRCCVPLGCLVPPLQAQCQKLSVPLQCWVAGNGPSEAICNACCF